MLYDCGLYLPIQVPNTYTATRQNCTMNASTSKLVKMEYFLIRSIHNE